MLVLAALAAPAVGAPGVAASQAPAAGEWRVYHGDHASTRYSPLAQVTAANVASLRPAWTWKPDTTDRPAEFKNENTPLMVNGTLYFTSGTSRTVVAADPATGATRWRWRMDEGPRVQVAPRRGAGRGVAHWTAPGGGERIFVVTPGFQLVALDAATGQPVPAFGTNGVVDLKQHLGIPLDPLTAAIGSSSPPVVFDGVVVIGPALEVGLRPPSRRNVPGNIIAIDARTGAFRWRFNTVPRAGEPGVDSWLDNSWEYTGNAGAWAPMSIDEKRGYLYVPTEAATGDYYGGHRPGDNLFSTSLVALDIRTGQRIWHQQIIRHDIWDWDNPTAPILMDITVDGRPVEAVVQLTKQAFAYVFDRVTGQPVWPMVDTPVPASDVPGERAAPAQPFPSRPAPYDVQGVTVDRLIDFTPALRAEAIEAVRGLRLGQFFAPASLAAAPDGTRGTLTLPGTLGGANWEHGAYDPETGVLYVGSYTSPAVLALAPDSARSDMDYVMVGGRVPTVRGLPLIKPPYSRITAIDMHRGEHLWWVANGDTPAAVRDNPALAGLTIAPTGAMTRPVILATRTLLLTAEGWRGAPLLRALDKKSGAEVARIPLPGSVSSTPMTYMHQGRQYVLLWVAEQPGRPAELLALALP
jgi:quinoprotein glucose dehydrogenase